MPELIGLDFETYGAEDLPTHGLARYARHKTFMPLIGSVAWRTPITWPSGVRALITRSAGIVSSGTTSE